MSDVAHVKPSELLVLLKEAIVARMPVLITGAPGIGKSDIALQASRTAGADFILSHPSVQDPTHPAGLPWVVDGRATFLPFGDTYKAIHAERPTVWMLEDFGQSTPAVQASYMQWLLARECNGHVLSPHVTFLAATNRRTDRAGVSGILEPVKSRFGAIVELHADLDEWIMWALDHNIPPLEIAFLRFRPDLLSAFNPSNDLTNSPSPRTWSFVAKILDMTLPESIRTQAIMGAVGVGAGTEFMSFLQTATRMPDINAILANGKATEIPKQSPALLYAIVSVLTARLTLENWPNVATYLERLGDAGYAEYGVLGLRDMERKISSINASQPYARLATSQIGKLVTGL